jgi:hypothetical protein
LKFAIRSRNVRVRVKRNSFFRSSELEIQNYKRIIADLEGVVDNLQEQLKIHTSNESSNRSTDKEFNVFTDDDDEMSGEENFSLAARERLMDNITNHLRLRNELSILDNELENHPHNIEAKTRRSQILESLDKGSRRRSNSRGRIERFDEFEESLLRECSFIADRILSKDSNNSRLIRQPSLSRNKSTMSLRDAGTSIQDRLRKLRDSLLLVEQRGTDVTSYHSPIDFNRIPLAVTDITSRDWQPRAVNRQTGGVSLLPPCTSTKGPATCRGISFN